MVLEKNLNMQKIDRQRTDRQTEVGQQWSEKLT